MAIKQGKSKEKEIKEEISETKERLTDQEPEKKEIKEELKEESWKASYDRQLRIAFFAMALILFFIFAFYLFSLEKNKFEYVGINFEKVREGKLIFYLAEFPITDISGNVVAESQFYFRNDPRNLENIPITDRIILMREVVAVPDTSVLKCEDSMISAVGFFLFLNRAGISGSVGTLNKTEAEEHKLQYVSCNDSLNKSVVMFREGNETKIYLDRPNCYIIDVANCEILNATERFLIGMYAHYRGIEV